MSDYYWKEGYSRIEMDDFIGRVITDIRVADGEEELHFTFSNGDVAIMYHDQDCCENVWLADVTGDFEDLIGTEVVSAEEVCSETSQEALVFALREDKSLENGAESFTWTFYHIGTNRGSVTLRWFGESNGYYSESVSVVLRHHA